MLDTNLSHDLVIGLDRSDRKADLHFINTTTAETRSETLASSPENLRQWLLDLRQKHPKASVGICLEQPAGHLIPFLETYDWITLYPINPISLQKYREAFVTSRAKDDGKDAQFLADLLANHPHQLKAWRPQDSQTRLLQQLVAHRRAIIDERTALTNRLQALLKAYFPQALELCGEDLWRPLATAFLLKWPTLTAVQKAKATQLKEFYYLNGSRSQKLITQRLKLVEQAVAVSDEPALNQSFALRVQLVCRQLQEVVSTVKEYEKQIAQCFQQHPDREIFTSFPGAGPVLAPRLLAAMGSERERFDSANNLQRYTGIAPVTKQSGKMRHVHRRYLCPKFERQSFHEYAKESVLWSRWAAAYYLSQRSKGKPHHTAVRALAFKWQRIIWRCWQSHTPYKEETYEAALRKSGSKLVSLFGQIEVGKNPVKNPNQAQNRRDASKSETRPEKKTSSKTPAIIYPLDI
jgi:transposase